MRHVEWMIAPKWVVTVDEKDRVLVDHAVMIDGGRIVDICPQAWLQEKYSANKTVYLPHHAIYPGFVNAHTHSAMTLFRGLADDVPLKTWLEKYIWPAESKMVSPEFVKAGLNLAMVEMIRGGTTCFNDHYFYSPQMAQRVLDSKMRGFLAECLFSFETPWMPSTQTAFDRMEEVRRLTQGQQGLCGAVLGPHSMYAVTPEIMTRVKHFADVYALPIHLHLHETAEEVASYELKYGRRPLQHLDEMGLLNSKTLAVHMTQVTDHEIERLVETGASVVHCPESNFKLASGGSPVRAMLAAGVNVALGTDGACSNNNLSMIGEMRSAAFLGKLMTGDPEALSARQVLRMATLGGAKALGLGHELGSLSVGKMADLMALDLHHPETTPCYDPVSALVYAASDAQVTHVWVGGRCLMENRQLKTLNESQILEQAHAWSVRIQASYQAQGE